MKSFVSSSNVQQPTASESDAVQKSGASAANTSTSGTSTSGTSTAGISASGISASGGLRQSATSAAMLLQQAFASAASRVSEEVSANFRAWCERNCINPQSGRIGTVSYLRAGELDERPGRRDWCFDAYESAVIDRTEPLRRDEFDFILANPIVALQLAVGITDLRGLRCFRRGLTQGINRLQAKTCRSRYYDRDNERRRRLAAERRRIRRRRTLNPCPTPEAFRAAFAHRADSIDARIFFGGLVHDLECYVDNCLKFDGNGEIVGRNGGVKAWIAENVPELSGRYKTIMRYKALAKRVRQVAEIRDPVPTDVLLPLAEATAPSPGKDAGKTMPRNENYYAQESHHARRRVACVLLGCSNTLKGLFSLLE